MLPSIVLAAIFCWRRVGKHSDYINAQNGIKFCPLGIWSIYNYTEKISMAPALRMVSSNPSFGKYFRTSKHFTNNFQTHASTRLLRFFAVFLKCLRDLWLSFDLFDRRDR
ncbi:hypothetical protein M438DRAFT_93715 [Aureobasidium pullulans EXF-150]|uniref:Uncharacterized protein n=1 Tax=Aureobasidium pullulans EXF-150 TaxID=1043002 RepID=A0A074XZ09_AURPU|nr:uncharacterized protein M438DRAFT_93715 [Aureobasidium pullulans EXF-150]KEQ88879.1 hypothetical protein M438DRAFT_93715 [Aureobasidium pullulans EXF-150]